MFKWLGQNGISNWKSNVMEQYNVQQKKPARRPSKCDVVCYLRAQKSFPITITETFYVK